MTVQTLSFHRYFNACLAVDWPSSSLLNRYGHHCSHLNGSKIFFNKGSFNDQIISTDLPVLNLCYEPTPNLYHFIWFLLPNILAFTFQQSKANPVIFALSYPHLPEYATTILSFFDILKPSFAFGQNYQIYSPLIFAPAIQFPSRLTSFNIQNNYLASLPSFDKISCSDSRKNILIINRRDSNNGSSSRFIENIDEVIGALVSFNVKVAYMEDLDYVSQLQLIDSCFTVITLHGAALASMPFLQNQHLFIECIHKFQSDNFTLYSQLSFLTHNYHICLPCSSSYDSTTHIPLPYIHRPLYIDLKDLSSILSCLDCSF